MKTYISQNIDSQSEKLFAMSDSIFDIAELGNQEYKSSKIVYDYLIDNGFSVEVGVGGLSTSFRATYTCGDGSGISIGLLCEYDAIEFLGHACGHHMQGPVIVGAAVGLKNILLNSNYKIIVYGTPAEETTSGKIKMSQNGCFKDIDIALMFHASNSTTTDIKSMASTKFEVKFKGLSSHAAIKPENGRSALDALLLAFHGLECLREHVVDDTRIHYSVIDGGGAPNSVHASASALIYLRSYNTSYLESLIPRFEKIIQGASLMTETTYEIIKLKSTLAKIPVYSLNNLLMKNAEDLGSPNITPPREKTGSTDFGNIMYNIPGSCIRVAFVPESANAHSVEYFDAGKTKSAHDAIIYGAKILAYSCLDLINDPCIFKSISEEFMKNKQSMEIS